MPWYIFAILSAIGFATSNILDKFILEKRIKNYLTYFVAGGFIWFFLALIILFFSPLSHISLTIILLAILTGFLTGTTWLLFYKTISKEEVSRAVALYYLFPIFVAILARFFLKEEVSFLKWLAIILTVCGAILISLKREEISRKIKIRGALLFIFPAIFVEAILEIIDKYVLYEISYWQLLVLSSFGYLMIALIFFSSSRNLRREVFQIFSTPFILKPVFIVHVIYFLASLSFLFAVALTQITYVSALTTSQPLFVFILTLILSLYFPHILEERLDRRTVLIKAISIILIVVGVLIIILT